MCWRPKNDSNRDGDPLNPELRPVATLDLGPVHELHPGHRSTSLMEEIEKRLLANQLRPKEKFVETEQKKIGGGRFIGCHFDFPWIFFNLAPGSVAVCYRHHRQSEPEL